MNFGGWVEPGFEPVLEAFRQNFSERAEVGAAVSVWHQGRPVVELHGGRTRSSKNAPAWTADTLTILFSATKGMAAALFLVLVDDGLDLDRTLASFWSAFDRTSTRTITIRHVLDHTSGLITLAEDPSLEELEAWSSGEDPSAVLTAIEAMEPVWKPGTSQGYHAITFGLLVSEIVQRTTGRPIADLLRERVLEPLDADVFLGLPEEEEHRVAELIPTGPRTFVRHILPTVFTSRAVEGRLYRRILNRKSCSHQAFARPSALGIRGVDNYGTRTVRAMALPWASGVASARGLAAMYAALLEPGKLVSSAALASVHRRSSWGYDRVLCKPMGFSSGFVKDELHLYSRNPHTFGHPGAGGCLGFADPSESLAFGYVMNRMDHRLRSPRALALARAAYRSVQDLG